MKIYFNDINLLFTVSQFCFGLLLLSSILVCDVYSAPTCVGREPGEQFGSYDGSVFYFCLPDGSLVTVPCPDGTFFVSNATAQGCVGTNSVNPGCTNGDIRSIPTCTAVGLADPPFHTDVTRYYYCTAAGAEARVFECEAGRAFLSQDGYTGCVGWVRWRSIRDCPLNSES